MIKEFNKKLFWRLCLVGLILFPFISIAFFDGSSADGAWEIIREILYYTGMIIIYPSFKLIMLLNMNGGISYIFGYFADIMAYSFIIERAIFWIKNKK
jgi:hypothetical protein